MPKPYGRDAFQESESRAGSGQLGITVVILVVVAMFVILVMANSAIQSTPVPTP